MSEELLEHNKKVMERVKALAEERNGPVVYLKDILTGRLELLPEGMRSVYPMQYRPEETPETLEGVQS
jgi:hypothetical protein